MEKQFIIYEGIKFWKSSNYYYKEIRKNGKRTKKALHHYIWEQFHKRKVPEGHVIHHKDGDKHNNNIENLQLMTDIDHRSLESKKLHANEEYTKRNNEHLKIIGEKAKLWHKSPEGIKWHQEHGKDCWSKENREKRVIIKTCEYCKKEFKAMFKRGKYCSMRCYFRERNGVKKHYK